MPDIFNTAQLITGSGLKDWTPGNVQAKPALPPAPLIIQPEEKITMTFRSELRAAIADAGTMTSANIQKKFPDKNVLTPLSQMTGAGHLKRKGNGSTATYSIGRADTKPGPKTSKRAAAKARSAAPKARRAVRKPHTDRLPPIARGNHIDGAIAELRQRIEGLEQAIVVLEALQ